MKKLIYTVHYGNYDNLWEPTFITYGWDYIVVTDNRYLKSSFWNVMYYKETLPPWLMARKVFILHNMLFSEYDLSIFIGGQYQVVNYLDSFIRNKQGKSIYLMGHPERSCIWEELDACLYHKKISRGQHKEVKRLFTRDKIPRNYGMVQTGVMIRNHNDESLTEFTNQWYDNTKKMYRDQLSFAYTWHYNPIDYGTYDEKELKGNFIKYLHLNGT